MTTQLIPSAVPATMTSREIAELTGKRHSDVLRDIDNLLESLNADLRYGFKTSSYVSGEPPREYRMFAMDRDSSYCLVAGYDANARMRIIKRWQELETQTATVTRLNPHERERLMIAREAYKTAKLFGFEGNMAILSAENYVRNTMGGGVLASMGATHLLADDRGKVYTPTDLGQLMNPPLTAVKFNQLLESFGLQKKELGSWLPTDEAIGLFEWADTGKKHSTGTPVKQLRWFKTVLERLTPSRQKEAA